MNKMNNSKYASLSLDAMNVITGGLVTVSTTAVSAMTGTVAAECYAKMLHYEISVFNKFFIVSHQ